jgi:hypothetical protein
VIDGRPVTVEQSRPIVAERDAISADLRARRRTLSEERTGETRSR